jgi:hypothetical protein
VGWLCRRLHQLVLFLNAASKPWADKYISIRGGESWVSWELSALNQRIAVAQNFSSDKVVMRQ